MIEPGPYIEHLFGDAAKDFLRAQRGWLIAAMHHSISWPQNDVVLRYDGNEYFLRGLEPERQSKGPVSASILVRHVDRANLEATLDRVYRFTSVLGWFKRGYVDVVDYITASHPIGFSAAGVRPGPMDGSPNGFNCNFMPVIEGGNVRRALAFWREGLHLEHVHQGYAFLSFYKVIESQFAEGGARGEWINNAIPHLTEKGGERVATLHAENIDVGRHIYESGRCAIAHASLGRDLVDPDVASDRVRIAKDLDMVRALAMKYIREELGVPDEMDVYRNRDALRPLYQFLTSQQVADLKAEGSVPRRSNGLNGLHVSINKWPDPPWAAMENLTLTVVRAHDGVILLRARNDLDTLSIGFVLSFRDGQAHPDLDTSGARPGCPREEIAVLEYQKAVLGNGIIELRFPNGEKIVCREVIAVNIDIGRTFSAIDEQIAALSRTLE